MKRPNQWGPKSWLEALRFYQFNVAINSFHVSTWQEYSFAEIFQCSGKCLYVNNGEICYCISEKNGQVTKTLILDLTSSHEEANSKMISHFSDFEENSQVIIHTLNVDVLVTALGCLELINKSINIWLEVGLCAKNSLRYSEVRKLYQYSLFLLAVTILHRFREKEKCFH